jgi:hypothetical protein
MRATGEQIAAGCGEDATPGTTNAQKSPHSGQVAATSRVFMVNVG